MKIQILAQANMTFFVIGNIIGGYKLFHGDVLFQTAALHVQKGGRLLSGKTHIIQDLMMVHKLLFHQGDVDLVETGVQLAPKGRTPGLV